MNNFEKLGFRIYYELQRAYSKLRKSSKKLDPKLFKKIIEKNNILEKQVRDLCLGGLERGKLDLIKKGVGDAQYDAIEGRVDVFDDFKYEDEEAKRKVYPFIPNLKLYEVAKVRRDLSDKIEELLIGYCQEYMERRGRLFRYFREALEGRTREVQGIESDWTYIAEIPTTFLSKKPLKKRKVSHKRKKKKSSKKRKRRSRKRSPKPRKKKSGKKGMYDHLSDQRLKKLIRFHWGGKPNLSRAQMLSKLKRAGMLKDGKVFIHA